MSRIDLIHAGLLWMQTAIQLCAQNYSFVFLSMTIFLFWLQFCPQKTTECNFKTLCNKRRSLMRKIWMDCERKQLKKQNQTKKELIWWIKPHARLDFNRFSWKIIFLFFWHPQVLNVLFYQHAGASEQTNTSPETSLTFCFWAWITRLRLFTAVCKSQRTWKW